ncbi:MAG: hypothetical protein GMKNLPBB_01339 [Myxococcota bacterium]|nr:hypothetical protein [Myxococcota bacterium]
MNRREFLIISAVTSAAAAIPDAVMGVETLPGLEKPDAKVEPPGPFAITGGAYEGFEHGDGYGAFRRSVDCGVLNHSMGCLHWSRS